MRKKWNEGQIVKYIMKLLSCIYQGSDKWTSGGKVILDTSYIVHTLKTQWPDRTENYILNGREL